MKKLVSMFLAVVLIASTAFQTCAVEIKSGATEILSTQTVNDEDRKYSVKVSSVSIHGMPANAKPSNFELYARPYAGNYKAATNYIKFSFAGYNGVGKIGSSRNAGSYSTGYGGRGTSYTLKMNHNYSLSCTVYATWTA